jgi:uncharacterized protein
MVINLVSEIDIKEEKPLPDNPVIMFGLPDTGLVGVIASSHILETKNMKRLGSIDSKFFPPMLIIHKNEIMAPTRIYGEFGNVVSIVSEITLPIKGIEKIIDGILDWLKKKNPKMVLFLGGIPAPNRMEIDNPKCYAVPSNKIAADIINKNGLTPLVEGVMVGHYALFMKACKDKDVPAIALLGEAFANYPDPGSAAIVIENINKLLNLDIDVKSLEEKAEEIRLKMKDLMKRTTQQMQQTDKTREYELPPLYM